MAAHQPLLKQGPVCSPDEARQLDGPIRRYSEWIDKDEHVWRAKPVLRVHAVLDQGDGRPHGIPLHHVARLLRLLATCWLGRRHTHMNADHVTPSPLDSGASGALVGRCGTIRGAGSSVDLSLT